MQQRFLFIHFFSHPSSSLPAPLPLPHTHPSLSLSQHWMVKFSVFLTVGFAVRSLRSILLHPCHPICGHQTSLTGFSGECVSYADSQAAPQTHWTRTCILARAQGILTPAEVWEDLYWRMLGLVPFQYLFLWLLRLFVAGSHLLKLTSEPPPAALSFPVKWKGRLNHQPEVRGCGSGRVLSGILTFGGAVIGCSDRGRKRPKATSGIYLGLWSPRHKQSCIGTCCCQTLWGTCVLWSRGSAELLDCFV